MTSREKNTVDQEGGRSGADHAMDLAKKHDKDLNTILVVAGLLSAVTSAFIIYIHPQLQTDPNEESADLLRVLLYNTDNAAFGGDSPKVD